MNTNLEQMMCAGMQSVFCSTFGYSRPKPVDGHAALEQASRWQCQEVDMQNTKFRKLIKKVNVYPPYLGMGIRMRSFSDDFTRFEVELRERWYNRNLFGTHFGGCLYSMCDPFFVFILTMNLGRNFIVWDKSAGIEFIKPASGTILGVFEISPGRVEEIRREVEATGKNTYHFEADLLNAENVTVARVSKEVYVRLKEKRA